MSSPRRRRPSPRVGAPPFGRPTSPFSNSWSRSGIKTSFVLSACPAPYTSNKQNKITSCRSSLFWFLPPPPTSFLIQIQNNNPFHEEEEDLVVHSSYRHITRRSSSSSPSSDVIISSSSGVASTEIRGYSDRYH